MTAFFHLVVVDELGIGPLCPTPRSLVEFVRKNAHGRRDGDALDAEKWKLVLKLPIEARHGNRRVGQPVQRDVVEDIIPRQAFGLPVERRAR